MFLLHIVTNFYNFRWPFLRPNWEGYESSYLDIQNGLRPLSTWLLLYKSVFPRNCSVDRSVASAYIIYIRLSDYSDRRRNIFLINSLNSSLPCVIFFCSVSCMSVTGLVKNILPYSWLFIRLLTI